MQDRNSIETASAQRLQLLIDSVVDFAIYMLDANGRVSSWNAGAERINGYSAAEILGEHYSRFFSCEDRKKGQPQRALDIARKTGRFADEGWRIRKDGSRFWSMAVMDAIRDDSGKLIGFAKVTRDMTERRQAEQALERTREALHQAQKMEAIGQLVGGVAHDFNNILTAIINNLELIKERLSEGDPHLGHLDSALQAARNGAALVQQMMVFARKQPLRLRRIDANDTVRDMLPLLERSCPENIEIRTRFAPSVPPMLADPNLLQTAVLNLVVNARDAMAEGGVLEITTSTVRVPQDVTCDLPGGRYVCLAVSDTGVGMPPEVLDRIFEPFFTTKELGKGTGLGLSQVYGFTKEMGGDVTAESKPDRGTTIRLYFPVCESDESPTAEPEPAEPVATEAAATAAGTAVVLLVEDDFLVSLATLDLLSGWGHTVLEAPDAERALEVLDAHPEIEILVTDVGLPGMSGHDLVREARARRPDLKVLLITGYDRSSATIRTPPDRNTAYVAKPYAPQTLAQEIGRLLGR